MSAETTTVGMLGGADDSRSRLESSFTVVDVADTDDLDSLSVVLVSTRAPVVDAAELLRRLDPESTPAYVVVHPGGESRAAALIGQGARGLVGEGHEALAVAASADDSEVDVVDAYDRQLTTGAVGREQGEDRDPVTLLPNHAALAARLVERTESGEPPHLAHITVTGMDVAAMSGDGVEALRRRLASQLVDVLSHLDVELYAPGDDTYTLLTTGEPQSLRAAAKRAIQVVEAFSPTGAQPLRAGVGIADARDGLDYEAQQELAQRSATTAAADRGSGVVDSSTLELGGAATTELDALRRVATEADRRLGRDPQHRERVAAVAHAAASALGYTGRRRSELQLASILADVGALHDPDDPATASASILTPVAGGRVARAISDSTRRWDADGDEISVDGRAVAAILAAAEDDAPEAMLRREAGTRLDPMVAGIIADQLAEDGVG